MSYNHIRKVDISAAKLLELWAYFDNHDLWYDLLKAARGKLAPAWFNDIVGSELAFEAAATKLKNHAFVERSADSDAHSMHHCVHAWLKNVLFKTIEDQNMGLGLICVASSVPLMPVRQDWMIKQRLLPHSEICLKLMKDWDQEGRNTKSKESCIAQFFHCVGILYRDQGRLTEAESMLLRSFNSREKLYGPDDGSTSDSVRSLADLYEKQDRLIMAESMYKRALTGHEKLVGPDHGSRLYTVHNLAALYARQRKLKEAESMYQRALLGYTRNPPEGSRRQPHLFYNIGLLYQDIQNFAGYVVHEPS